ncbi:MAG: [protein-PII] uridylyltransferase [Ilumatobacteraceae bacterium]
MVSTATSRREDLIADESLGGLELCRALSAATDELLVELFEGAIGLVVKRRRKGAVALVAVGGYGRQELAPQSDVDVLLVYDGKFDGIEDLAKELWYPLWDAGLKLGHAVRSLDDQLSLAGEDLDTATALLSARPLAGDDELGSHLVTAGLARWRRNGRRWLDALRSKMIERRTQAGDVAFLLEPDLKDGHGGLRDVHTLWWAADADLLVPPEDMATLDACYDTLVDARVALHREKGRPGDVLRLEDQDAVASRLRIESADVLMSDIASAARTIGWIADGAWRHLSRHQVGHEEHVGTGLVVVDREIELSERADIVADPTIVLRAARVAAQREVGLARATLDRLTADVDPAAWSPVWPDGARDELVALLQQGHRAIDVLEALDQRGILVRLVPEWAPVRSRPQRNAYHRFTVDRHLWETAANASALTERVSRPDLLLLGALFHDVGKGYPGDHIVAGMEVVRVIAPRLGLAERDTDVLVRMVQHHLLLPDVAVRRDLTDPATIQKVADAVGDVELLALLAALTEADSLATGPSAWGSWKAQLVADLVERTRLLLDGADIRDTTFRHFPDQAAFSAMAAGVFDVRIEEDDADPAIGTGTEKFTVVCLDRPGSFARIAGVLSLRGLDVLTAWAFSGALGGPPMAASQFRVVAPRGGIAWDSVIDDLRRALGGELAIEARLDERARTYRRRRALQAAPAGPPSVTFHDDESAVSTVVEVRAPNNIGVLHRITRAIAEVGLDIRHATVQTLGEDVVDTFYVQGQNGRLITDDFHRGEIERAILHAVS